MLPIKRSRDNVPAAVLRFFIGSAAATASVSPCGTRLVVGYATCGTNPVIYSLETGDSRMTLDAAAQQGKETSPRERPTSAVAYHPNGKSIMVGHHHQSAFLWSIEDDPKIVAMLPGQGIYEARIEQVVFAPNGDFALTVTSEGAARLWDMALPKNKLELPKWAEIHPRMMQHFVHDNTAAFADFLVNCWI
jgi:WD40 repeat protein